MSKKNSTQKETPQVDDVFSKVQSVREMVRKEIKQRLREIVSKGKGKTKPTFITDKVYVKFSIVARKSGRVVAFPTLCWATGEFIQTLDKSIPIVISVDSRTLDDLLEFAKWIEKHKEAVEEALRTIVIVPEPEKRRTKEEGLIVL